MCIVFHMETGLTARRGWTKVELAIEECFAHQQNFGLSFVRKRRGLLVAFFNRALHALLLTLIAVYIQHAALALMENQFMGYLFIR